MNYEQICKQIFNGKSDIESVLTELLKFDNFLYSKISQAAVQYGNGTHPKHRLTKYHDFFVNNVNENESVLDLGCGRGDVTYDISRKTKNKVIGLELNRHNISYAKNTYRNENLSFICGNIYKDIPNEKFDVIVMSNVLEHLKNRNELLSMVLKNTTPSKVLLRVPHFEREWIVPIKKELGINYLLDSTHEIEYTYDEFVNELEKSNLIVYSSRINWGEIWAVCKLRSI